jgi:hypothetical protein
LLVEPDVSKPLLNCSLARDDYSFIERFSSAKCEKCNWRLGSEETVHFMKLTCIFNSKLRNVEECKTIAELNSLEKRYDTLHRFQWLSGGEKPRKACFWQFSGGNKRRICFWSGNQENIVRNETGDWMQRKLFVFTVFLASLRMTLLFCLPRKTQ